METGFEHTHRTGHSTTEDMAGRWVCEYCPSPAYDLVVRDPHINCSSQTCVRGDGRNCTQRIMVCGFCFMPVNSVTDKACWPNHVVQNSADFIASGHSNTANMPAEEVPVDDELARDFTLVYPAQGGTYARCRLCLSLVLHQDREDHQTWHRWLESLMNGHTSDD